MYKDAGKFNIGLPNIALTVKISEVKLQHGKSGDE